MTTSEQPAASAPQPVPGSFSEFVHAWRYFLWLLGLILILVALFAEENWRGEWAWDSYRQKMATQGEPIEKSAVVPPRVPDDQNFAMTPVLAPMFGFVPGAPKWPGQMPLNSFATNFDAASRELKGSKRTPSSSWLRSPTDLPAWYVAFKASQAKGAKQLPALVKSPGQGYRFQFPTNTADQTSTETAKTNYTTAEAATGVLEMLSQTDAVFDELR